MYQHFYDVCVIIHKEILKSADKALRALQGMRGGLCLEGTSSKGSRKRHTKAECSKLFSTNKKPKVAWKHRFVCLAYMGEGKRPTSAMTKDELLKAGLGEKTIEFPTLDCSAEEFRDLMHENFPKLKNGGGYEFCRCLPNSSDLEPLSSAAYASPRLLKERVGNARTYIRPLQKDLDLDEVMALPTGVSYLLFSFLVYYFSRSKKNV